MKANKFILFFVILNIMSITACSNRTPTLTGEMVITNVALTVQADLTKIAADLPTNTPTPDVTPTPTQEPFTPTTAPTLTPTGPTPTNTSEFSIDNGVWVSSNPPDGSVFVPNQNFTMTVTLMNTGDTTWTTSYYIKFSSGDQMKAPDKIFMPYPVPPSKNVQIAIPFTAPESLGLKRSTWKIVNAQAKEFATFWCEIEVASAPLPTVAPTPTATATP